MYKEIQLTRAKSLSKKEIGLIDSFNHQFRKRDFHVVPDGNSVQILLREVDMARLRKSVEELSAGNGLLTDILAAVEGVGGYGIRGKKRDYVNYNKERKVKNRAAKELQRGWPGYFDKLFAVFDQCIRVLKHGGRIVVNIQPLYSDYIPSHHIISNYFINKKLIWKGEILWEKNNYNCKYTAWGSWKSPGNPYLKYTWEFIEIFCKGDLKKPGRRDDADISAEEFKRWVVGKWSIAPERRMKQFNHPAMFPESLARRVLKLFSFRGDFVVDPFNGAGTTTLAAGQSGRRFLGIDISEEYCQTAEDRLSQSEIRF